MKTSGRTVVVALFAAYAVQAAFFVFGSRTNIDEGMFLGAGRLVWEGAIPYRDFPFSQGPVLPYFYGAFGELFGHSLLVGRIVSYVGSLVAMLASLALARSFGGSVACVVVLLLSMTNLPALWVSTTVRTQSLATPLILLALLALSWPKRSALAWAAAPSLLLWATGARVTNAVLLVALCLWVGWQLRGAPATLLRAAGIVAVQALVVVAPALVAPGGALFHVFTAQLTRDDRLVVFQRSALERLAEKFEFLLIPGADFLPILALALGVAVHLFVSWRRGWRPAWALPLRDARSTQLVLLIAAFLVFAPHLALNRGFLTYFVTSSSILIPAIAIAAAQWMRGGERVHRGLRAVVVALWVVALMDAVVHRGTWLGAGESGLPHFRKVARELRALAGADCTMLSFQTQLVLESGCRALPGLEYSLFSFFPKLPSQEAAARGVLNPELLDRRVLALRPELIALTRQDVLRLRRAGRGLAIEGGRAALDFLPSTRGLYVPHGRVAIGSGIRLPGTPDSVGVRVFVRKDLLAR